MSASFWFLGAISCALASAFFWVLAVLVGGLWLTWLLGFNLSGRTVGVFVPGQLVDYFNHAFGLAGQHEPNSDKSWFPPDIKATIFYLQRYIDRRAN